MIFPKGEVVHKNLSTSFTNLSALISTLKLENFSGTIEIDFPDTKGVLLIDSGQIVDAEVTGDNGSERILGDDATQYLLRVASQKDGILSIYRLLPEQVILLANNLRSEPLFKGLSTNFIHFDQLLAKLKEGKHNGFIEVMNKDHHPLGVLFLEGGEPVEMFTIPKNGPAVFGRMSIQIFIENVKRHGALFNVYGREGKEVSRELPQTKEEVLPEKESESVQLEEEDRSLPPPSQEEKNLTASETLKETISLLEEFLSESERIVDTLSKRGMFLKLFRRALIEKSEQFDFLDPFAGEFDYREGRIEVKKEVEQEDLVKGIVEAIRGTLSYLEKEVPREKMLSLKLKAGIETFLSHHKGTLKRLRIDSFFSSLI